MITHKTLAYLLIVVLTISACNKTVITETHEKYRPEFHFTPDSMWMNDPNGLVFYQGEYHLFYQHYPKGTIWGPMHWGHAVSTDLVNWEHLPIALFPDSLGYIFSGSAVFDSANTSGLGSLENPPLVAIFTYHNMEKEKAGNVDFQYQGIAYSTDKGRSWTKYISNPVLGNPGKKDFRDPKVFWYSEEKKWVMVLAVNNFVRFYSSPDLKKWSLESEFGEHEGAHGGVWECPDLFSMKTTSGEKWVLLVSMNNGAPNGGSGTQYFVGDFDGKTFTNKNSPEKILWLDYGKDNYAGVTWSNIPDEDGRRLFLGWMSNWQYANKVPSVKWRNAMTVPRTLELQKVDKDMRVITKPVKELELLRKTETVIEGRVLNGLFPLKSDTSGSFIGEIELVFQISKGPQFGLASDFGLELSNSQGESLLVGFETSEMYYYVDRSKSGNTDFSTDFPGKHFAPSFLGGDSVKMHILIDESSVELFADDGKTVMTEIFFSEYGLNHLNLYSQNGSVKLKTGKVYTFGDKN